MNLYFAEELMMTEDGIRQSWKDMTIEEKKENDEFLLKMIECLYICSEIAHKAGRKEMEKKVLQTEFAGTSEQNRAVEYMQRCFHDLLIGTPKELLIENAINMYYLEKPCGYTAIMDIMSFFTIKSILNDENPRILLEYLMILLPIELRREYEDEILQNIYSQRMGYSIYPELDSNKDKAIKQSQEFENLYVDICREILSMSQSALHTRLKAYYIRLSEIVINSITPFYMEAATRNTSNEALGSLYSSINDNAKTRIAETIPECRMKHIREGYIDKYRLQESSEEFLNETVKARLLYGNNDLLSEIIKGFMELLNPPLYSERSYTFAYSSRLLETIREYGRDA